MTDKRTWTTATFDEIVAEFAPRYAVTAVAFAENRGHYPVVKIGGKWYDGMLIDPRTEMPAEHATDFDIAVEGDLRP